MTCLTRKNLRNHDEAMAYLVECTLATVQNLTSIEGRVRLRECRIHLFKTWTAGDLQVRSDLGSREGTLRNQIFQDTGERGRISTPPQKSLCEIVDV